ncbi:LamG domain-containing protein [Patescibacteria group bacterium]|nr:MAG: LamG domain-containing protein [Patescibacteria group bacterium]
MNCTRSYTDSILTFKGNKNKKYCQVFCPQILFVIFSLAFLGAVFFASSSAHAAAPRTGLVGWWTMDANDINGTTVYDKSGKGNNGTGNNITSADLVAGKINQSLDFDGGTEYITTVDAPFDFGTGNFTAAAWVKVTSQSGINTIFDKYNNNVAGDKGWILRANTAEDNKIKGYIGNGAPDMTGATSLIVGKWYHVAMVRNGDNGYLYLNGAQDATASGLAASDASSAASLYIGVEKTVVAFVNGSLDDARVYSRALSGAEVKQLYDAAKQTYTQAAPSRGLVGYWSMDGNDINGTKVYDKSGKQNHGTSANTPSKVAGKISGAMSFNGTSDWVNVANPANLQPANITASVWVKLNSDPGAAKSVISKRTDAPGNASFFLGYRASANRMSFSIYSGADQIASSTNYSVGVWQNWVGTFDGSNVKLYRDSVLIDTKAAAVSITYSDSYNVTIGNHASSFFWPGSIDDIRIYNRALSAAEVKQLYDAAKQTYTQAAPSRGLVGYWSMDGNDINGTKVYDKSGQQNHGTSANTPTKVAGKVGGAMNFNGTSDLVTAANQPSLRFGAGNFSLSAWIKTSTGGADSAIIIDKYNADGGQYQFQVQSNGKLHCHTWNATPGPWASANTVVTDNKWHYVTCAVSANGATATIYLDGVQDGTNTGTAKNTDSSGTFLIGRDTTTRYFNGSIDDVRVYNRALSAAEVKQLYNAARAMYVK